MPTLTLKAYEYIIGLIVFIVLCVSLWGWGDWHGHKVVKAQWDAANNADIVKQLNTVKASDIVTTKTITQIITLTNVLMTKGATINREVPVYVTPQADARCVVPVGAVRVLNAAAGGQELDADPIAGAYDGPSTIALSGLVGVTSENLKRCRINTAKYVTLRSWVDEQLKTVNNKTAP